MKVKIETVQAFVEPYAQVALDGALGLTSEDLATALGVSHHHILEKIRRGRFAEVCRLGGWSFHALAFKPAAGKRGGRPLKIHVLDVDASKVFVSRWDNARGIGYLKYLLTCERIVEHGVPLLNAKIRDLEAKVVALCAPKRVRGGPRRHRLVAGWRTITDIFGESGKIPVYRDLLLSEMTDQERRHYEATHLSKISAGASDKAAKLLNHETDPGKRSLTLLQKPGFPELTEH